MPASRRPISPGSPTSSALTECKQFCATPSCSGASAVDDVTGPDAFSASDDELAQYDARLEEIEAERPPAFTDEALALSFASKHGGQLRYVAKFGRWFVFDGMRWRADETRYVFDLIRKHCRAASVECSNPKLAHVLASRKTSTAVYDLANSDRRLAATHGQWDCEAMHLNTPLGVFDLRTGLYRPHRPEDYMTQMTAVAPGGDCPAWLAFLDRVLGGDREYIAFLQRVAGYVLTGLTTEHALFFLYGLGANGKSVFIDTLAGILSTYHRTTAIETFTASPFDRHPTDLAALRGVRVVTAVETEEGRRWAESKIKAATGGDTISARFMRQDSFEYKPRFKLMIAGNHKPGLRSVDEAMRRRLHLLPFLITIPLAERDQKLTERLKDEWPGILQWMIDGCLMWQAQGLCPPPAVSSATAEYLEAEDALGSWLDECVDRSAAQSWTSVAKLFASWSAWAEKTGEHAGKMTGFSQKLEDRGLIRARQSAARGFVGIRLLSDSDQELA
jgi:putative DNA primase/helicase